MHMYANTSKLRGIIRSGDVNIAERLCLMMLLVPHPAVWRLAAAMKGLWDRIGIVTALSISACHFFVIKCHTRLGPVWMNWSSTGLIPCETCLWSSSKRVTEWLSVTIGLPYMVPTRSLSFFVSM